MTKEKFVEIINEIKKLHEYEDALYALNYNSGFDSELRFPTLEDTVISLLEEVMHCPVDEYIGSDISYFIYDLDFGKDWEPGMIIDKDGNSIDHSTTEKLYDYIVKEYGMSH